MSAPYPFYPCPVARVDTLPSTPQSASCAAAVDTRLCHTPRSRGANPFVLPERSLAPRPQLSAEAQAPGSALVAQDA